jgi:hypothetical protein
LQRQVNEYEIVCEKKKSFVNVAKSKVMRLTRRENVGDSDIALNEIRMEDVRNLGVIVMVA